MIALWDTPITIHLNHYSMSQPDHSPQAGVVNFDHLRSLLFNDTDYIKEMLQEFLTIMPLNMQELKEAAQQQQWEQVAFLAHRLKSSLGIVPITNAMEITRELETKAREAGDTEGIIARVEGLAALLEKACREIAREVKR